LNFGLAADLLINDFLAMFSGPLDYFFLAA